MAALLECSPAEMRAECHRLIDKIFTDGAVQVPAELADLAARYPAQIPTGGPVVRDQVYAMLRATAMELFPDQIASIVALFQDPAALREMSLVEVRERAAAATAAYRAEHPASE